MGFYTGKHRAYERSEFYRDVEIAGLNELHFLKKYSEAMLRYQRPPDGNEYLRLFFHRAHHHILNRLSVLKYKD